MLAALQACPMLVDPDPANPDTNPFVEEVSFGTGPVPATGKISRGSSGLAGVLCALAAIAVSARSGTVLIWAIIYLTDHAPFAIFGA